MDDLRQGVTIIQHAVLDHLERRTPQWRMMAIPELQGLLERGALDAARHGDFTRLAAIALHIAERGAGAPAGTSACSAHQLAAMGIASLYPDGDEWGCTPDDLDPLRAALDAAAADSIHPVIKCDAFIQLDPLFAVLVPFEFDDGLPVAEALEFHPTARAARQARAAAFEGNQ